jgi:hypothetical protein
MGIILQRTLVVYQETNAENGQEMLEFANQGSVAALP